MPADGNVSPGAAECLGGCTACLVDESATAVVQLILVYVQKLRLLLCLVTS